MTDTEGSSVRIQSVLAGHDSCDALAQREQAFVRAAWGQRVSESLAALDLQAEFARAGDSWSDADNEGKVVVFGDTTTPSSFGRSPD